MTISGQVALASSCTGVGGLKPHNLQQPLTLDRHKNMAK